MRVLIALIAGALFSAGLLISGMGDPAKLLNFLSIGPRWDPSVAVVMGAGAAVMALGFLTARSLRKPLFTDAFAVLPRHGINLRLVGGAAMFGLGWGLMGLCPGPAVADLVLHPGPVGLFIVPMIIGIWGYRLFNKAKSAAAARVGVSV
jgi:uncharacterized membrane protein YedE/YeeE